MGNQAAEFFVNELLISSSSSEDEDFVFRGPLDARPRIQNYIEEVVDLYSEREFRENFRMHRATFNYILELIREQISTEETASGRHTISAKAQLLITLWYFGTPDCYRSICGRFDIGKATGLRTIRRVAEALFSLSPNVILWPTSDPRRLENVIDGFLQMGFPDTIGCIDGMYIKIPMPKDHGLSYISRKNFPCIILQGVCDHTLQFTHCYAGEVGSTHDANVLKRSDIWYFMNDRAEEKFPNDTHLIGDKAYPCLPELMTPYKNNGHLTRQQVHFNFLLSSTRSCIERAFSLLQKRFRCLKDHLDVRSLEWIPKYVIACCFTQHLYYAK